MLLQVHQVLIIPLFRRNIYNNVTKQTNQNIKIILQTNFLLFDTNHILHLPPKTLITNYYSYLGIKNFCELEEVTLEMIQARLDELVQHEDVVTVVSKIEVGVYLLHMPGLKQMYDFILYNGWSSVLSYPDWVFFVKSIIAYQRVKTTIRYWFATKV